VLNQKEGNGNIHMNLRFRNRSVINIRDISSLEKHRVAEQVQETYQDSWVVWYVRGRRLLRLFIFDDFDVFHITPPEDDELEFLLRWRYEFFDCALLGAK
jgi:hypothetical protein